MPLSTDSTPKTSSTSSLTSSDRPLNPNGKDVSLATVDNAQNHIVDDSINDDTVNNDNINDDNIIDDIVNIVIVGAGMAGSRLAIQLATAFQDKRELDSSQENDNKVDDSKLNDSKLNNSKLNESKLENRKSPNSNVKITLIGKEPQIGYNRIMLSPVLAGEKEFDDTYLYTSEEYKRLGIDVLAGVGVVHIDKEAQQLLLDDDSTLSYDKLVLATGSTARVIPFPGHKAPQVHVFRDVSDVYKLQDYAKQGKTGLVIGGGVLGLEAACALAAQGGNMSVIHVDDYVLNRQLDLPAAMMLQDELACRNVGLEVSAMSDTIALDDNGDVIGLNMKDGKRIPADFIVMAVGIMPNIKLATDSGIEVNRGIIVDAHMHTNMPNIYAIGECVEINEELFGMVSSVNQHVDSLISVLTYPDTDWQPFVTVPLSLKLKVSGVAVFSAGQIAFNDDELESVETIVYRQQNQPKNSEQYHCLYIKDNKLLGAVLYGETNEGAFFSRLINESIDISAIKDNLIYGEAYCKTA